MNAFRSTYELPVAEDVFRDLQQTGLVCFRGALTTDFVARCQQQVHAAVAERGERYFTLADVTSRADSPFASLGKDPRLLGLMEDVCRMTGIELGREPILQGNNLRVIAGNGEDAEAQSLKFHYDSSILTMLVPVIIPDCGDLDSGHLVARLNDRPFGGSTLWNLCQKSWVQNALFRRWQQAQVRAGRWNDKLVKLDPGSLYLFWGYRSLHANLPCRPGSLRATALMFFGRPHPHDWLMRLRESSRYRKEARILEQVR
jgi:hypothetical protein